MALNSNLPYLVDTDHPNYSKDTGTAKTVTVAQISLYLTVSVNVVNDFSHPLILNTNNLLSVNQGGRSSLSKSLDMALIKSPKKVYVSEAALIRWLLTFHIILHHQ